MDQYKLQIKFKDQRSMEIDANSEVNPKDTIGIALDDKSTNILQIGYYFIKKDDILWMKVEGEELEKHIRE